jgi:hypothetical protein
MRVGQSEFFNRQSRRRLIALAVFASLLTILFLIPRASSTAAELQGRSQQRRRIPPRPSNPTQNQGRGGRNYSRFKHEDHRPPIAKLNCSSCHAINSPAEPDVISAATKPSVKGYPYHDSCVGCHRQQFFKGASPAICTVCHTRSSPRLTAHDIHPFPKQGDQAIAREFPGYFPHSLHQSVIARNERSLRTGWSFVRASFTTLDDQAPKALDNCATCHETDQRAIAAINVGGTEGTYKPEAKGTFKTVPTGHASCFNCHWQSQEPTKDNCAGCHLSQSNYTKKKRSASPEATLPGVLSPNAVQWFKTWPGEWPKRLSIKFRHDTPNHDVGCTTCHINITQMETLNIPKADVPIATCAPCHISNSPVLRKEGVTLTIFSEMSDEAKDKDNKTHTCIGCHTSTIGRERPPCTHYLVLGQQCKE